MALRRLSALACAVAAASLAGCGPTGRPLASAGGDPGNGGKLVEGLGCGDCHEIPGASGAHGLVGPSLRGMARRTMIAGLLPNTPDDMVHWLRAPQTFAPGNVMPNIEMSEHEARDIAAYLYTLE